MHRSATQARSTLRRVLRVAIALAASATSSWSCASNPSATDSPTPQQRPTDAGGKQAKLERHEINQSGVGVDFRIVVYCADVDAARNAQAIVAKRLDKLGDLLDRTRPTSELAQLEENAGLGSVRVTDEFYALFRQLDRLAERSEGAFDITTGAAAALWKDSVADGELPTDDAVAHARERIGQDKFRLDAVNRTIALTETGMRCDIDDIIAAYACDCILEALQLAGFPIALVDAGRVSAGRAGCILVGDAPSGKPGWRVFVDDADASLPEHRITLTRNAIVTSSRLSEIVHLGAGVYAPLIDPTTGVGSRNVATVTVVAPHAWLAASLARGAALLGEPRGRMFVRGTPGALGWYHYPAGATRPTIAEPMSRPSVNIPGQPDQPAPFLRRPKAPATPQ